MKPNKFLYSPVSKVDMKELLPGYDFTRRHSHAIIIEPEKGKPILVNSCSKGYYLQSNIEVIKPFQEALASQFDTDLKIRIYQNAVFFVDVILKGNEFKVNGDIILPRIQLINSYNGKLKFSIRCGFYRQFCSNGMVVPVQLDGVTTTDFFIKGRHTESLGAKANVEKLLHIADSFIDAGKKMLSPYKILGTTKVPGGITDLENTIKEISKKTKFPIKQASEVLARVNLELTELNIPLNYWVLYNGFNYQLNHNDSIKALGHKKEQMDESVLNFMLEICRR